MRAVFLEKETFDLNQNHDEFEISDKNKVHHLVNVLRLKQSVEIILFNENGQYAKAEIINIEKKKVVFKIDSPQQYTEPHQIELALCWLKKDALEDAMKIAIQIGITKLHMVKSQYSQQAYDLKTSRLKKVLVSAMEQSNHFKELEIYEYNSLDELFSHERVKNLDKYGFTLHQDMSVKSSDLKLNSRSIYLIGPEGGLSTQEIETLSAQNMKFFHLPTPIMRAPVAVSCALGYIVARI